MRSALGPTAGPFRSAQKNCLEMPSGMCGMSGSLNANGYNYTLVALSAVVAVLTTYTTADIVWCASAFGDRKARARWFWTGAAVLSLGAWATHVIGMLATNAHFSFTYRLDVTTLSVLLVLSGSIAALQFIYRHLEGWFYLLVAGLLMGFGLTAMCVTGMHAVVMSGTAHNDYALIGLSCLVAVGFSIPALGSLRRIYRGASVSGGREKVAFAVLMAIGILGMHYIDMASMNMTTMGLGMGAMRTPVMGADEVDNGAMAMGVSAIVVLLGLIALWSSHQHHRGFLREKSLLQEAKEYTDSILRTILDGIVICDERGLIQSVNPSTGRVFGYAAEEMIGKSVSMLMPQPCRDEHDGFIVRYLKTGEHKVIDSGFREVEGLHRDGTVFPLEISLSEVRVGKRRHFMALVRDITQRREAEARLVHLAHYDALTGLPSRTLFRDRATHAILHAARVGRLLAVLYLDLDHFKPVNDRLGHEAGDQVLKIAAQRITGCLRATDTASRVGGDEFVVVLSDLLNTNDAFGVAKDVLAALAKPFELSGKAIRITVSVGVAIYPADGEDLDSLVKEADDAMYRAKKRGRNNFQGASNAALSR